MEKHKKGYHVIGEIYNRANISPKNIFAIFANVLYNIKNITMEKHLHKSVNCSINSQKMPTSRWRKATKLPELVPAKYHLNLKNFSNSSEKSHLKHRNNFHSGSDSRNMANFTCTISKKPLRFTAERLH